MKVATIELKRGSSYGCAGDLIDFKRDNFAHPWTRCLLQAIRSAEQAKSLTWLLICRRDHRLPIVYMESWFCKTLGLSSLGDTDDAYFRLHVVIIRGKKLVRRCFIHGVTLDYFLSSVKPQQIIGLSKFKK